MKKLLLASGLALLWGALPAQAQCVGVGGINSVPQVGIACLSEPTVGTYVATGVGIIPAASATDIACLTGSATKTVRLQAVRVSGSGTAISVPVLLKMNLVADTGGTAAVGAALPVPYAIDSTNPAVSATATAYTANPTITGTAGILNSGNLGLVATTVGAAVQPYVLFDYAERTYSQAPTLRGIAQQFCVNLNATSPTALLNVSFRWTEAPQ